jgi:ABC-type glycerol-3-phosphate transport system permease component
VSTSGVPFSRYILNSLLITGVGVFLAILFTALSAYGLAKLKFRGKKLLFEINTISLMFVPIAVQIPRYIVVAQSGMIDTYFAHIFPLITLPVAMFLIKQFIDQIPNDFIEASRIDGASEMQIFFKVIMPMIAPAVATVGILAFQLIWNDTSTSTLFINDESLRTLAFFLQTLTSGVGNTIAGQGMAAAASLIMFIPNLILFIILQSQVMSTMAHSGLK